MIPVEDFTGPTISEIQKFIEITDDARKEGEVSVALCFLLMLIFFFFAIIDDVNVYCCSRLMLDVVRQ